MKNGVVHEICTEFFEEHGDTCKICPDFDRCNCDGFKPLGTEAGDDLAVVIDFADGYGYEVRAGQTADHFVLT